MAEPSESTPAVTHRASATGASATLDGSRPRAFLTARRSAQQLDLVLAGAWRAPHFAALTSQLATVPTDGVERLCVDARGAELDLAGAWLLREFLRHAHSAGAQIEFPSGTPAALTLLSRCLTGELPSETRELQTFGPSSAVEEAVEHIGRRTVRGAHEAFAALSFIGQTVVALGRALLHPRRLRPISISRHIFDTGITAVPIVALIAFLIAVILAYLGEQELRAFGATIFVVDLVTVGVLRELGVLLTAIVIAGRSGSAFAAELGAMQLNEEIDALQTIGVDPVEVLVLPRLLGLMIALPLLTLVADLIGLAGGGVLCHLLLDMPTAQYLHRVTGAISSSTFWVGIAKAPLFAAMIALAGCFNGMRVRVSSRELGRRTTVAVVEAIFCVILIDALSAVLFMRLDI